VPELLEGRDQPWRIILTNRPETLPPDAPLFTDAWHDRTLVRPGTDLPGVLRGLASEQGILSLMVEAGGKLSAALFAAGLVDEVVVYLAPLLCGGPVPALGGDGLTRSLALTDLEFTRFGDDMRLRGRVDGAESR
jgi:diaminohydroxyphosphoribosylaminopyrimidine deaminase/5-amino-6-(5-phosphoribosylamino)uracil reductase